MITADVVVPGLERTHWHMWDNAKGGALWLGPLVQTDAFQLYAKFEDAEPDLSHEGLRKLVRARTGRPELDVTEVLYASHFGSRAGLANHFRVDRVFPGRRRRACASAGGGQGMNTAVQDAYNLGWKLGHVLHGAPQRCSILRRGAAAGRGAPARIRRADAQGLARQAKDKEEPRRGEHMQLGLNYRGGPLSLDERAAVAEGITQAGDRAPDARLSDAAGATVRLFDLLRGPHFTLLAFGGAALPGLGSQYGEAVGVYRIAVPRGERRRADRHERRGSSHLRGGADPGPA